MATAAQWLEGARLRTLPAALAPVIFGSAAAAPVAAFSLPRALLAAVVALGLQVGVNYANDYSDGIRGTDDNRNGPPRLTGGGLTAPHQVKAAALASFVVAGIAGITLVALCQQWWLLTVGLSCVIAAWYYTGGSKPYGYLGLGEVFVFVFFGLIATAGTTYSQALSVPWPVWVGSSGLGLIACAILMANNIRDIPTDMHCGKQTLAVRLGDRSARQVYLAMLIAALILGLVITLAHPWAVLTLALVPALWLVSAPVIQGKTGPELIPVLRNTGFLQLGYAIGLAIAITQ